MKRFHHRLFVICALVLMFALAASLSPAAYAEYPHRRGNKGLKADKETTQQASLPQPADPADSPDDSFGHAEDEAERLAGPADDEKDGLTAPSEPSLDEAVVPADEEPDPDAEYDNNLDDLDIEEILEANTYESVMKNHSAFTVKTVTHSGVTGYGRDGFYCGTNDYNYYEYATEAGTTATAAMMFTERNAYRLIRFADGDTGFYLDWDADPTRPGVSNDLGDSCMSLDAEAFLREILIDVEDSGKGTLVMTTADDTTALRQRLAELPEEWENGIILRTYELDSESLEIQYLAEVLLTADDEEIPLLEQTVGYRDEKPETLRMMLGKAGAYEEEQFTNPCEITVIYDPDTKEESVCRVTIERGDSVLPLFLDGYELYTDLQRKHPYMGVDGLGDMTIYAFPMTETEPVLEFGPWSEEEKEEPSPDEIETSLPEGTKSGPGALPLDDEVRDSVPGAADSGEQDRMSGPGSGETPMPAPDAAGPADDELLCMCGCDMMFSAVDPESNDDGKRLSATSSEEMPGVASASVGPADEMNVLLPWANIPGELMSARASDPVSPAEEEAETGLKPESPGDEETISALGPAGTGDVGENGPGGSQPEPVAEEPGEAPAEEESAVPVGPVAEEDFSALMRELYIANKLDLIFLNHKSVEYLCTYDFEAAQGYTGYTYETAGMAYYEDQDSAAYASDSAFYRLTMDERGTDLIYVFDFCNNYDPYLNAGYEIVPENYEDWWDAEAESVTEYYEEDGKLFLKIEMNEQKSREFVEDWLRADYDGEIVTTEITADADSREMFRFAYHVEKEGVLSIPVLFEVAYDQPMPRTAKMLRAVAERDTEWTASITVVMNPGAKDEVSQTMTVPVGSTIVYATDVEVLTFEDRNCTLPADSWDGKTSQTFYLMPVSGLSAKM